MLFSITVNSQSIRKQFSEALYSDASKEIRLAQTNKLLDSLESEGNDSLYVLYDWYAYWLYDNVSNEKAIQYDELAYEQALSIEPIDSSYTQGILFNLGWYYTNDKHYLKSIEAYQNSILMDNSSKTAITAYLKIGYAYAFIQDYYNALKYNKLAISLLKQTNQNPQKLREAYQNIAYISLKIKTLESIREGRKYGRLADSLIEIIPTSDRNRYNVKYVQAQLHNRDEDVVFEVSKKFYDEAMEVAEKLQDSTKILTINLGHGVLYKHFDTEKSIEYLEEALKFSRTKDSFYTYQVYTSLGYNEDMRKQTNKSIELRHKALAYLTGDDFRDQLKSYDSLFIATDNKTNLLHAIPRLGESYLNHFEKTGDPSALEKSIAYFSMGDRIIDLLKLNSSEYRSRLFWRRLSTDLYGKAIRACFLKDDPEKAFYFMEKNKSLLLLEDLSKQKFENSLSLPQNFLKQERDYNKSIVQIDTRLQQESLDVYTRDSLQKTKVDLEIAFSKIRDSVVKDIEQFNFNDEISSISQTQGTLSEEDVIIEYHISIDSGYGVYTNNDRGYILAITRDKVQFFEVTDLPKVKEKTLAVLELIKKPFETEADIVDYAKLSNEVYEMLFPSEELQGLIAGKNIRIVPDSYLSFLPFEALSTSSESIEYLLNDCTIQYQYSNSFLKNLQVSSKKNNDFLAMIPEEFALELPALVYSKEEIKALNSNYRGKMFNRSEATKETFLNEISKYGILHLATHANAQDSITPWIAFNDEKLNLEELYLAKNNASLVFLSGCNTTVGKQETGEGVMSLARGFFYSGASSVISSLWSIDDRSTSELVTDFYENLAEGQTKSEALRNAKLTYLNSHSLSERSPYYWASFVVLGDDAPIPQSFWSQYRYLLIGIGIVLMLLAYRTYRKRK